MLSTTFPHELHAGGSLLFLVSSPCNEAIHLPSRSMEMKNQIYSPSAAVRDHWKCKSNSIFTANVFWLALREKRSECLLRFVGPHSLGKHFVLEFHSLLQLVTECLLHEPLACLHCPGGLLRQGLGSFRCC